MAAICRRHGIATSMVFRWRADLGFGKDKSAKLAAVRLADGRTGAASAPLVLHDLLQPPIGMVAVDLPDGRRVFAPSGADPDAVRPHARVLTVSRRRDATVHGAVFASNLVLHSGVDDADGHFVAAYGIDAAA